MRPNFAAGILVSIVDRTMKPGYPVMIDNDLTESTPIRTPDQRLRVFVSSTMVELADERRAASEAIRNLRMSPVLFEIGARPHPPRDLYAAYLRQSDVFIGIYGEEYGWIDANMSISGIEDEYELSTGKPRLIYLREAQERDQRLAEFVDRITREGSVCYKTFSDSDELRELIEDDLAVLLSERFQSGSTGQAVAPAGDGRIAWSRQPERQTPQIQYATTADGVRIAYYAIGQGPAVMSLMLPFSHLEAEWQIELFRNLYEASARQNTLIRLDHRGFGLSDREAGDYSIDSMVLDVEAVVARLGMDQVRIYSVGYATIPALAYTARHPELVTHFIQASPAISWTDATNARLSKLLELAEIDWQLATETITRSFNPAGGEDKIRAIAGLVGKSIDHDGFVRFLSDARTWDAQAEARSVTTPTLLIHRKNENVSIAATRRVAGLIKDSRVVFVDNDDFQGLVLAQRFFSGFDISDQTEQVSA